MSEKENENLKNDERENKADVTKAVLICVSIFIYFLAIIATILADEVFKLGDALVATTFLSITAVATVLLIFTLLTRKSKKSSDSEEKEKTTNPIAKSIFSILGLITTCVYLLVSFLTGAWHITWIIWIVYAICVEIVKLIFRLKGVEIDE